MFSPFSSARRHSLLVFSAIATTMITTSSAAYATPDVSLNTSMCPCKSIDKRLIRQMIVEAAYQYDVPAELALAVAKTESAFQSNVMSVRGARGVMQIMPATAKKEFGVDADALWDAETNINIGVRFLRELYDYYGQRWDAALSHYNGGTLSGDPATAQAHGYTRNYVRTVNAHRLAFESDGEIQTLILQQREFLQADLQGDELLGGENIEILLPSSETASDRNKLAEASSGPQPALETIRNEPIMAASNATGKYELQMTPSQVYANQREKLRMRFRSSIKTSQGG